ncbi:MAG: DUF1318 domain-containing protein [Sphingomicrobium sp.]
MKRALLLALAATMVAGQAAAETPASAVARARAAGQVGERYDGYLGIALAADQQLHRQVTSINLLRRSLYARLAQARGVAMQEIGITAGCQLLGTVGIGQRYALSDNVWRVRGVGQGAPVPDYCR